MKGRAGIELRLSRRFTCRTGMVLAHLGAFVLPAKLRRSLFTSVDAFEIPQPAA
jgi:hypothetical protein